MDRKAIKPSLAAAVVALTLGLMAGDPSPGRAETPAAPRRGKPAAAAPASPRDRYHLDEVKITGRSEMPKPLFALPRRPLRLLPMRPDWDGPTDLLRQEKETGTAPR